MSVYDEIAKRETFSEENVSGRATTVEEALQGLVDGLSQPDPE